MISNTRKKRKLYRMEISDMTDDNGVYALSLVYQPAIEELFVHMSKEVQMIQLQQVSGEKQMLVGPVLIPNKEISRVDDKTGEEYAIIFPEEVVEKAAQLYLLRQNNNNTTLEHSVELEDLSVVESWIIEDPLRDKATVYNMTYPKGTWMVKMKVNNKEIWDEYVKTGKVRGFSLEGMFGHRLVAASKAGVYSADDRANLLLELASESDEMFARELLADIKLLAAGGEIKLQSYSDYPDTVKNAAKRGIDLNEKVDNKCATQVGKIRAQQLANGEPLSIDTIKRMYAYTSRAREFYNPNDTEACGTISYLLWGGDAANAWAERKLKELEELETSVSIASSYAGQFGDEDKKKPFKNGTYIAELAEVGPRGGIVESPKAPKSDTKNPEPKGKGTAGGSAAGKRGAEVSAEDEKTLKDKADEFNDREANTKYGRATLGVLKSVFQRGLGAYNTSRSPEVARAGGAKQWALARVNAYLYLLKNGRPQNTKYTQDNDLLPKGHPKA